MRLANSIPDHVWLITFLLGNILFVSCGQQNKEGKTELSGEMAEGQKLAGKYCSTCHLPVNPSLLDKETWKNQVLPAMAKQLGLEVWQNNHYFQNERSAISQSDWLKIIAYYDSLAPAKLAEPQYPVKATIDWSVFSLKKPGEDTSFLATTTLVSINKSDQTLHTSSAENPDLLQWDSQLKPSFRAKLPAPAVNIFLSENQTILTSIGELKAFDTPNGALYNLGKNDKPENYITPFSSGLIRPIHTIGNDFNKDGLMDYVVCSFGHNKGGLYLLKQLPDKTFAKTAVREVPGATQAISGDFNKDGWPDIMALFAHADEGIWLFLNNKNGGFEMENILRFPPVYGSSSFQLIDMNQDGKPDVVYTAGDNSDYSRILKPYHGLYIFINKGDLNGKNSHFEQSYFYPMHGVTKVIANDFDQDGDVDLAAIAFFADFKDNPAKSFLYFEQNNNKQFPDFKPHAIPISNEGRWICMDVEDMDGDGDMDIVLGNYSKGFLNQENLRPSWNVFQPFVILKNEK